MDPTSIVLIVIGAAIVYFAARFLGHGIKIAVKLLVLAILIIALLSFLVYKDVEDLKNGFKDNNNTFLLYENDTIYTGVVLKPLSSLTLTLDSFSFFTREEMDKLGEEFQEQKYDDMMGSSHKIFFFTPEILQKPFTLSMGELKLNETEMLAIIKSDEPFDLLARKMMIASKVQLEQESGYSEIVIATIKELYGDEEKLKGTLFAALIGNYFQEQKPGDLIKNIKSGALKIYPEGISFKIIRFMPWLG
jgi:energy-coupling factor transporter transmembrane protein EcfT